MNQRLMYQCELRGQFRRICRHLPGGEKRAKPKHYGGSKILSTEEGRKHIIDAVQKGTPFMAARFGTSEGNALYEYWKKKLGRTDKYSQRCHAEMCVNAGFFPDDDLLIDQWAELETDACRELNILGVMNFFGEEWIYRTFCNHARLMPAGGIASAAKGWTWCLAGKRVLVIHPFTETIQSQYYNHREEFFPNSNALPAFDLKCIRAVQTIADTRDERFADWFEALDYMTEEATKHTFDVALIGCGAYGFQLASRIKKMGKVAIHMGGALQTLFGIKGVRWDKQYSSMYNDAWVYPSAKETPKGAEKVESGCYWGRSTK